MHYKFIVSLVFLILGYHALAQESSIYTYQGKTFRPGDQIMIQSRAGTFKPADSGHYNELEAEKGQKGELIRVDLDVATIKWDAQTWEEYESKKQVKLPSFVATVHLGYLKVLSSKQLSKEKLAEYANYKKYSDEETQKFLRETEEFIAKYGEKYIYRGPEEDQEVSPANSEKGKTSVARVEKAEEKESVLPEPEPAVEEVIPPDSEEEMTKEKTLSTNALISIGGLVGILFIGLLLKLSGRNIL